MRFEMGNEKCVMGKAGVSLITVLMFMLIATIAATATYKWITSEGHSSASRMMEREAYQSSIAGLENARAWMTFHANETGALIRQYLFDEDGNPKDVRAPINLDKHIRSFAQENTQNHHVWLVGVNTTPPTFKVKILSEGRSRCGRAQHTEVAIFNVDGLYQVDKPKKTVERKDSVDFDYAYFGGSYHGSGNVTLSSAVVNGNWSGNPQSVTGNFIVTGDAVLSGNNANVGKLACIGGNLGAQNQGMGGQDLYVGGNVKGAVKLGGENVEGNAYFEGDVNLDNTSAEGEKNLSIYGNVTLNGFMRPSLSSKNAEITGNLCTSENGAVVLSGGDYRFTVGGNVWMPGQQNLYWGSVSKSGSGCTCRTYSCQCNYDYWENGYHWVFSKACEKGSSSGNWRIKSETCTEAGTQACSYGDPDFIECENYTNVMNLSENYDAGHNICDAKNASDCKQTNWYKLISLGNSATSEVYIKSGFKSSKYKSNLYDGKYFYQAKDYPRQCVDNSCNNKYWDGEWFHPYSERSVDDDRYYIYNMPANKTDVGFGTYTDDYWHKTLRNYFIDYYEADNRMNVRFTAGDHAYDEYHPVFVSYATDVPFGDDSKKYYRYLHHDGSKITGSPYCILNSGKNWQPVCGVTPWFKSNATSDNFHNKDNWADKPFSCAEDVKEQCIKQTEDDDGIMKAGNGCDGSSYIVKDPIVTGKKQFEAYAGYGCAANITTYTTSLVTQLNDCYDHLFNNVDHPEYRKDSLYNDFLVVRVSGGTTSTNPSGKLKGRFIVIAADPLYTSFMDVEDTSYVFYYMESGIGTLNDATRKNTFIYSEGEIGTGNNFKLSGTIYATAASCAGMGNLQSSTITSDPVLNQVLAKAGIICDNDKDHNENTCGGDMSGSPLSSGSTTITYGTAGKDNYFVSTAPQLGVTLESQYTTTETPPVISDDNKELAPSFIVLPRIIYLTKDPDGKLSDYYNVLPLNGANVTKATANVSCDPSLNISTNLVSEDEKLAEGLYECKAEPDGYDKVPFWVWVQGTQSSSPLVSFVEPSENITPGEPHEVKINLPPHAAELQVKVEASGIPAGWTVTYDEEKVSVSGSVYTIRFGAELSGYTTPTILTVTPPANAENGSLTFVLKTPEENAGYQLGNPWSTTLLIATTTILVNQAYDNSSLVSLPEINAWCADNTGCPDIDSRSTWPDCPYKSTKTWVVPNWTPGYYTINKNSSWNVVTCGEGTLSLMEKEGSGCVVIIPALNNSIEAPILKESTYYLRAIAKAKSRKLTLKFVGDAGADLMPAVTVSMGSGSKPCSDNDTDRTCVVSVFDGDYVKVYLDETAENNANFSYWKCLNNGGSSCPTTDLITSYVFGTTPNDNGFLLKDDNAIIEIHFGEQDKHCFFDEFRRTQDNNTTHSCDYPGESETEYCIGSGTNAKWKLVSGGNTGYIKRDPYQGYVVASSTAPNTGVKVLSTVDAGIRGTLKALFSPPHATASFDKDSWKIKNSGFLLRAKSDGTDPLFLNVYENTSGRLAARLCGGSSCLDEVELLKSGSGVNVTTSSMVMLSATLEDENTLKLRAYTGNYYSSGTIPESDYYKAEFDLSGLSNNHADMTYQYIGFSLADRDFKIYGIGWQSDDYNSECFDGPPSIKCSFAATAVDGFIPTNGSAPGQSTAYQKPWVGHSGWFDSKSCQVSYSYEGGTDAIVDGEGYKFDASGAGAHGYKDPDTHNDVKTAYASLANCVYMSNPTQAAWTSTVTPAHCGAFWTGQTHDCKKDNPDLLAGETKYIAGNGNEWKTFAAQNLRGVDELTVAISNDNEYSVDLEMWLESQSTAWGGTNYESRHVRITGNNKSFTRTFNVKNDLADNASGFDPENVVSIQFKNNLNTAVTVSKVVAPCTKAVHFEGCSVEKNGETGWKMTLDVPDNPDKLKKMTVKATVDGGNYTGLSKTEFDYSDFPSLVLTFSDPGRYANAGRTYEFSAQVYSEENEYTSEFETCTCTDCTIGAITCSSDVLSPTQIEEGESNPQFHFELSGCPSKGCAYEVWLNGSKIKECTKTQAESASGCPGDNPTDVHITGSASLSKSDDPYVYEVKNVSSTPTPISNLDDCKRSFKVVEHVLADVTCDIGTVSSSASSLGGTQAIPHGNVTVSCEGGGCTYSVKEGSSVVGGPTAYTENYDLSFTGASEAGKHEYTAVVQRGSEDAVNCTGKYTLTYPLSVTCGPIGDVGSESSPHDPSASVSVGPSNVVGCNSNCTWTLTGGVSPSASSGSGYDDGDITFKDEGATGEQNYTLTIKHAGTADVSCGFKVTYTTPSSSSVASSSSAAGGCKCATYCGTGCENNITTGNVYHNNDNWSGCVFLTSATRINNNNGYSINGTAVNVNGNLCYDDAAACASKLAAYDTADGGWYFKIDKIYTDIHSSGYNPCATVTNPSITACPVASATVAPGGKVDVTPTTTNCNVLGGCDYTITPGGTGDRSGKYYSGTISFTGESTPGTVSYTIAISNSAGSAPSTCTIGPVTYSAAADVAMTNGDVNVEVDCNKSIRATNTNTSGCNAVISCSGSFNKTVGNVSADQYNSANYTVGKVASATVSTSCASGNTMKCTWNCW